MRGIFLLCLLAFLAAPALSGQTGIRWDLGGPIAGVSMTVNQPSLYGKNASYLVVVAGAKLNWCAYPANSTQGTPCTNYAPTYTDLTLGTACPNTKPIVLQQTNICASVGDASGNLGVNTAFPGPSTVPGYYTYTLTVGSTTYGPYTVTIGGSGGGGSGVPAGSLQLQVSNSVGTLFTAPIPNVAAGSLLASFGTSAPPAMQSKIVVDARDGVNGIGGVKCDDVTDDTAALQNLFTYYGRFGAGYTVAAQQIQLQLPIGHCLISNQVVFEGANNLGITLTGTKGLGANLGTTLSWSGPNFGTMMLFLGCNGCRIENLDFLPNPVGGGPNHGAQNALWIDASNTSTPATYTLSSIVRAGNVVTATTPSAHAVSADQIVKVAGSTGGTTSFNGTFRALYSNDNTHISWIQGGSDESGTASTGTVANYQSTITNNVKLDWIQVNNPEAVATTISAISGTNPVQVTTATPHFINSGDQTCLRNVTDTSYIGCYLATVTSSTTANLVPVSSIGMSPSGTASSGGTLLTGSSGIRFSHHTGATPEISAVHGSNLYMQGDQLGGTAVCIESDNGGNTKDFIWENMQFNGCRYGFSGFQSGNFNVLGYTSSLSAIVDTLPTLRTVDFVNMQGQITVTGAEMEGFNETLFAGSGQIHLDGISYQSQTPTDDMMVHWGGSLTLTNSFFNDGRATNATPQFVCGQPLFATGGCTMTSIGNFYANTGIGGAWSNPGFLPVTNGTTATFACPGGYCMTPLNVVSLGDYGSSSNFNLGSANTPLNNVLSAYSIARQQPSSATQVGAWNSGAGLLLSASDCIAQFQPGNSLCEINSNTLNWNGAAIQTGQLSSSLVSLYPNAVDNFAGSSLSANWTQPLGPVQGFTVSSGVVSPGSSLVNPNALAYWSAVPFAPNQFAQAKVASLGSSWAGPAVRIAGTGPTPDTYYAAVYDSANLRFLLYSNPGTGYVYNFLATCAAPSVGDTIGISATGSTISITDNGTPVCGSPITDTTLANGSPGITAFNSSAGNSSLENFSGGSGLTGISWQSDTGLSRTLADTIAVGNGAQGDFSGSLKLTNVTTATILPTTIYSAAGTPLPSCVTGIKGELAVVSDATTPTYMGTYTSGGAVVAAVICNGSAWLTH
jgi:hypothetical protein